MALLKVVKIKKIVDELLNYIQYDFNNSQQEEDTFLYRVLNDNIDGDYNFYEQGKSIFLRTDENPRKIETSLMFNKNTNGMPHIHIRESLRTKGTYNNIGGVTNGSFIDTGGLYSDIYRDTKRGSYEIVITSNNPLDVILITEIIYTLLIGAYETFNNLFGLFDFTIKELMFQDNLATSLYAKGITLDTQIDNEIPSIIKYEGLNNIKFFLEKKIMKI